MRDLRWGNVEHLHNLRLELGKDEYNLYATNDKEIEVEIRIGRVVRNDHIGPLPRGTCLQVDFFLITLRGKVNPLLKGDNFALIGVMRIDFPNVLGFVPEVAIIFMFFEKIKGKMNLRCNNPIFISLFSY